MMITMQQITEMSYPKTAKNGVFPQVSARAVALLAAVWLLLSGCVTLPSQSGRPSESAYADPGLTESGRHVGELLLQHDGQAGMLILDTGRQAFLHRAALIESAERSIDAQYYIWNSDVSGGYLARRLLLAADRGVRVRLLLDDVNVAGRDPVLAALDRHPNIQIRIYNPFVTRAGPGKWLGFIADFQRLNRRMHNKTFVVDATFGIVGGRNIGDEYFDLHPEVNFRDRDVLVVGPVVQDVSMNFDAYWNNAWSYPIANLAHAVADDHTIETKLAQARAAAGDTTGLEHAPALDAASARAHIQQSLAQLTWAPAELVFDPPAEDVDAVADEPRQTAQALRALVDQSRSEVLIESAYLILGDRQLETMPELRARGVRVAALTNSLASNDLTANHAGYARWRSIMLTHGMELYELRPDAAACAVWFEAPGYCDRAAVSLHAKSAVFDRKTLYVGSFNVNLRSIYLNGETVLIIHSPELAQRVARDIEQGMAPENSWQVGKDDNGRLRWSTDGGAIWTHEPATDWWRRLKSGLFGLLPLEKYL